MCVPCAFNLILFFYLILSFNVSFVRFMIRVSHDNVSRNRDARAWYSKVRARGLISVSRMHIGIVYIGSQYKYSCPRFWDVRTPLANPGDFSRSIPFFSAARNEGGESFTSESKHVTFPKEVAPTKKHDFAEGGRIGIVPETLPPLRGPSIHGPLFDWRVGRCRCRDRRDWINRRACRYR